MTGGVALLRGINVGGNNKLPMESLRSIGSSLGLNDVSTYINSGNLLFSGGASSQLAGDLAAAIFAKHKIEIPVVVCSDERLVKALENNPFPTHDPKLVLVYFCSAPPSTEAVLTIDTARSPGDSIVVVDSEVYLSVPSGAHKTKFTLSYLEKTLGVRMTSRNINTVSKLCSLSSERIG